MEYQKITNLLDTASNSIRSFNTKRWINVYDQSGNAENRYKPSKQIRCKTSMLQSDHILLLKEKLLLQEQIMLHMTIN